MADRRQRPIAVYEEGGPRTPGLYVVFDGEPGPAGPRFIEVEDETGRSVALHGGWRREPAANAGAGLWTLGPFAEVPEP